MILALAARHGARLPTTDLDEFRARYAFTDLQSFLDLHYANLQVLRSEEDFYELAVAYLGRAHECNVRRAEIFFDPQTHLANGVPLGAVINGLTAGLRDGERRHHVSADLIMCFLRHLGADAADEMLTAMLPFRDHIIGVGLDSTEIGFPNPLFADVFARAAAEGLHLVAHAGEEGDAQCRGRDAGQPARRADRSWGPGDGRSRGGCPPARRPDPVDGVPAVQRAPARRRHARRPSIGRACSMPTFTPPSTATTRPTSAGTSTPTTGQCATSSG